MWLQYVIPDLIKTAKTNRVYMGVGPEQNFTYIAALKPAMAFIVDIRRGNLDLHLVYKALFELAADRADFVSLLFSRKRPQGLTEKSTAAEIFDAFKASRAAKPMREPEDDYGSAREARAGLSPVDLSRRRIRVSNFEIRAGPAVIVDRIGFRRRRPAAVMRI